MKLITTLATLFVLLSGTVTLAQMYQYYDENNQLSFTDDYSMIPENQRPRTQSIPEAQPEAQTPAASPSNDKAGPDLVQDTAGQDINTESPDTTAADSKKSALDQEFLSLSQEKVKLDQRYSELKSAQETLSKTANKKLSFNLAKEHNQKIEDLNKQIQAYQKDYQAYMDRAAQYNEKAGK